MSTPAVRSTDPISPTAAETALASEAVRLLAPTLAVANGTVRLRVEGPNAPNEAVVLPTAAFAVLLRILNEMAKGNTVAVFGDRTEVTTEEVARLLDVSPPYACRMLEEGKIPSRPVGTHKRARLIDVLSYRADRYQARKAVLDRMAAMDQELGLV
jgi:excisionase family DNA binding protein